MEKISATADTGRTFCEKKIKELQKEKEVLEGQLSEMNRLAQLSEKGLSKALEDKNRTETLLEDSRKINEDLSRKMAAIESNKIAEIKDQNYHQLETDTEKLRSERDNLQRQIHDLKEQR